MKKNYFLRQKMQVFINCMIFLLICTSAIAQNPQNHVWALPPNVINFDPVTQIPGTPVSLPMPNITEPDYPDYYGQPTSNNCSAMQDMNGNLLFFIQDGMIYDKDGYFIDVMQDAGVPINMISQEICIVPEPGNCDRYYIFGTFGNNQFQHPFYSILDMSVLSIYNTGTRYGKLVDFGPQVETSVIDINSSILIIYPTYRNEPSYAASKLKTDISGIDYRFVFMQQYDLIYRLKITAASYPTPTNEGDFSIGNDVSQAQSERPELELVDYNGGYRIACAHTVGTGMIPHKNKIFKADLDINGELIMGTETNFYLDQYQYLYPPDPVPYIHGLEFSPNGQYLYFTHETNSLELYPIEYIDCNDNTRNPLNVNDAADFSKSQIELGSDGKLYFASINRLATLSDPNNPDPNNWNDNAVTLTPNIYGEPYTLPDQIDGMDYTSVFNTKSCCIKYSTFDVDYTGYTANTTENLLFTTPIQSWYPGHNPWNSLSGVITVQSNIVIPAGYNITIKDMTFEFAPRIFYPVEKGAYIIVESSPIASILGARLTLDNTVFKSYTQCGDGMWEGVWVEGQSSSIQGNLSNSKQGWLTIKNNSVIEDAYYGVFVGRFVGDDPTAAINPASTGGVVRGVTGSKFLNNTFDVKFDTYTTAPSMSYFSNCTFETNMNTLLDGVSLPAVHAYIIDETNLRFRGCIFQNVSTENLPYLYSGLGILSVNAGFSVSPLGTTKCEFNNLNHGIIAWNWNLRNVVVTQSKFTNNYRGIWLSNVNYCTITSNDFSIYPYMWVYNTYAAAYGLYLDRCMGFHVEDNWFTTTTADKSANDYGIIVNEENPSRTCGQWDEIYRNRFNDLLVGCQAQGYNSEWPGNSCPDHDDYTPNNAGLVFRCNDYALNTIGVYDINVTDDNGTIPTTFGNIAHQQGTCWSSTSPAGNNFSHSCPTLESDYSIQATPSSPHNPTVIEYSHNYDPDINSRLIPSCFTPSVLSGTVYTGVDINNCSSIPVSLSSCQSQLNPFPLVLKASILSYQKSIDSISTILANGDAQSLMTTISTGNPGQINNSLLAQSPYLSDRVLIAAVNKGLPAGILKEIIVPNSPVTQDVTNALNTISLPQGIINQINDAQTGVSGRSEIINLQSYFQSQKSYAINELIRYSLADTLNTRAMDSVIYLLKYYNLPETQCDVAKAYLAKGDTTAAKLIRDSLMMAGVNAPFCQLMDVIIKYVRNSGNCQILAADAQVATTLNTVAADASTKECASAQGLLKLIFGGTYSEWIEPINHNNLRTINPHQQSDNIIISSLLSVYPNPTDNNAILTYTLPENTAKASIIIYDLTGRVVYNQSLTISETQIEIPSATFNNGIYFCTLIINDSLAEKVKFVVIR